MSTQINISVGDNKLVEQVRLQQNASRQAQLDKEDRARVANAAATERTNALAAQGKDANGNLITGIPFSQPQIERRPAANRIGGHKLFVAPVSAPITTGSYNLPEVWADLFPTGNPPRRWWAPTKQTGFKPRVAFLEPPVDDPGPFIPGVLVDGYVTYNSVEQCFNANNSLITSQFDTSIDGKSILHYSIAGTATDSIQALKKISIEMEVYIPSIPNVVYNGNTSAANVTIQLFSNNESSSGSVSLSVESSGSIFIPNTGPNAGIDQRGYFYTVNIRPSSGSFTAASLNFTPDVWMPVRLTINGGDLWQNQNATNTTLIFEVQGTSQTYSLSSSTFNFIKPLFVATKHNFVISGSVSQNKVGANPYSPAPQDWKLRNVRYLFT